MTVKQKKKIIIIIPSQQMPAFPKTEKNSMAHFETVTENNIRYHL